MAHVCPWWGGYFIDNPIRRLLHRPRRILEPMVRPGMTAMDFGCGMGLFTIAMARLVGPQGRVIAVDLQPRMLDVLRRRASKAGVADRIVTHACKPNTIGRTDVLDFALAFYSAHEVPDLKRLITELHQRLRPGGRLLIVEPIGHVNAAAFEDMMRISRETGFTLVDFPPVRLSRTALLAR